MPLGNRSSRLAVCLIVLMGCAADEPAKEQIETAALADAEVQGMAGFRPSSPDAYFSLFFESQRGNSDLMYRRLSATEGDSSVELFLEPSGGYVLILEPARGSGQFAVSMGQWGYRGWDLSLSGVGILRLTYGRDAVGSELIVQSALRGYPLQGNRFPLTRVWGEWSKDEHLARVRAGDPGAVSGLPAFF